MSDIKAIQTIKDYSKASLSDKEILELRKKYSYIKHVTERNAKLQKCVICGCECSSFCKSHLIPQFILKGIAKNGELTIGKTTTHFPLIDKEQGIGNALTFRCICNKCDNEKFQAYEDENSYVHNVTEEILKEISIKNYLSSYSRQIFEIEIRKLLYGEDSPSLEVYQLDAEYSLKMIKREIKGLQHYIIDEIDLDYETPIAFQGEIGLLTGFDGEVINEYVNKKADYDPHVLHVVVFPFKRKTKIILFINDGDKKYRKFYKHFRTLSLTEKLYAINYLILLYKEDWALSPDFQGWLTDAETDNLIRETQAVVGLTPTRTKEVIEDFKIKTFGNVHNFLTDHI